MVSPEILTCASDSNILLNDSQELLVPDLTGNIASNDNYTVGDSLIITQNPESGTYLNSGGGTTHEVIITVEDEDGNTETCTVILTGALQTDLAEINETGREILVYPNPSVNKINVLFVNNIETAQLKLYDMYGRLVLTKTTDESNQFVISKSEVNGSGVYLFRINNNQELTGKVIFR